MCLSFVPLGQGKHNRNKPESQPGGQAVRGWLASSPFSQATCSQLGAPWPSSGSGEMGCAQEALAVVAMVSTDVVFHLPR